MTKIEKPTNLLQNQLHDLSSRIGELENKKIDLTAQLVQINQEIVLCQRADTALRKILSDTRKHRVHKPRGRPVVDFDKLKNSYEAIKKSGKRLTQKAVAEHSGFARNTIQKQWRRLKSLEPVARI